jgi:hypothetical protein
MSRQDAVLLVAASKGRGRDKPAGIDPVTAPRATYRYRSSEGSVTGSTFRTTLALTINIRKLPYCHYHAFFFATTNT